MRAKIMGASNLESTVFRLECCRALINALCEAAEASVTSGEALNGVSDLLGSICRDFQADIDSAEDYTGEEAQE